MTQSVLDGIPGLGETRRKRLLRHFGSVKRMREASVEEIGAVKGVPATVARAVHEALHPGGPTAATPTEERDDHQKAG
jgi:excinuclease ABC subunit C